MFKGSNCQGALRTVSMLNKVPSALIALQGWTAPFAMVSGGLRGLDKGTHLYFSSKFFKAKHIYIFRPRFMSTGQVRDTSPTHVGNT